MKNLKIHIPGFAAAMLYTFMAGQSVLADDTEVFVGPGGNAWGTPNVLFIIDTSGSMRADINGKTPPVNGLAKIDIVKNVLADVMKSYSGFNAALMRFDGASGSSSNGGSFITGMKLLDSSSSTSFINASNNLTASGSTPLAETLYEAALFYRGDAVDFGDNTNPVNVPEVLDTNNTNNYQSPITSQCQTNYVILLTDGEPTSDYDADSSIQAMPGYKSGTCGYSNNPTDDCLDELAQYLHTEDQSSLAGKQTVETYTIGFLSNQALLQDTANKGGGKYVLASNQTQLKQAFDDALGTITKTTASFSPPVMAANAFNNISHRNILYFTLFEPAVAPKWQGNIKPYKLVDDANNIPRITDFNKAVAVKSDGTFEKGSLSFWHKSSTTSDGENVVDGGANDLLPLLPTPASRNLYTYTGTYTSLGAPDTNVVGAPASADLSDPKNALINATNSNLTLAMLGVPNTTAFNTVIDATRKSTLADPLHSKPVLVNYGGTKTDPDLTLFAATNGGFLHAFNASTDGGKRTDGQEQFAFIPQELLSNLTDLASSTGKHPYGLDGDVTAWVNDVNKDGDLSGTGDHVYVYAGMRRGGSNYYALDVTNRKKPKLKWVIKGGTGDFSELGESWSRPAVTTIKSGSSSKTVLIFGGGYDTAQDSERLDAKGNVIYGAADIIGRAIFIVDAETGKKLWQAGPAGSGTAGANPDKVFAAMTNSIPSDVRLVDSNLDGHTDRLYVGDMHGQIFRIDLMATLSASTGVQIASLGGTTAADDRRFYYPPDVVVTQQPGLNTYVSINIGSGYRAGPLNLLDNNGAVIPHAKDNFYSLRDPNVIGAPTSFTPITHSNSKLIDATTKAVLSATETTTLTKDPNTIGWFITMGGDGEKVLAPAITINGEILFTTYTPPGAVKKSSCAPPPGKGNLYRVSLYDATATQKYYDSSGNLITPKLADRVSKIGQTGIPAGATVMFRDNGNDGVELIRCVGTKCEKPPSAIQMEETYWRDEG